ncbi:MAG: hypothetical protein U0169_00545 [Polyangiaceae bacterium]
MGRTFVVGRVAFLLSLGAFAAASTACSSEAFRVAGDDAGPDGACEDCATERPGTGADGGNGTDAASASDAPADVTTTDAGRDTGSANADAGADSGARDTGSADTGANVDAGMAQDADTSVDSGTTPDAGSGQDAAVDAGPTCALGTRLLNGSCVSTFREDQISAGDNSACFVTTTGGAKCWGWNAGGKLGNGNYSSQGEPNDVVGLTSGVVAIGEGYYSGCAVLATGAVKCWGSNADGELGNASLPTGNATGAGSATPVDVDNLTNAVSVSVGLDHACALTSMGGVKCWGHGLSGELGNAGSTQSNVPVGVQGLSTGVAMVRVGWRYSCALTTGGGVKCWGTNAENQLGNPQFPNGSKVPVDVAGLTSGVVAIETASRVACAVLATGGVKCWGDGDGGWLGTGNDTDAASPVDVVGLAGSAVGVTVGGGYGCALLTGGSVQCWGKNNYGAFGIDSISGAVTAISGGGGFACGLTQTGALRCAGQGDFGQLGNGLRTTSAGPVLVTGL